MKHCPRTLYGGTHNRTCAQELKDFKCPQHGLIREAQLEVQARSTPLARLGRIAEAHFKYVDQHGGTLGLCHECNYPHPCPTYVWATTDRDAVIACWDPADDDKETT